MNRTTAAIALLASAIQAGPSFAQSPQSYPSKPIRILLTISGGADIVARLVGQAMSASMGQPVIVEVQSAAVGAVAVDLVMRAAPDGHTLLLASAASQLQLARRPGSEAGRSLAPITKAVDTVLVVVSNPSVPAANVRELIEHARRNPGKLSFSSSGTGGVHHLSGEEIRMISGIDWLHVPYKGGIQALTDTISGQVHVNFGALSTVVPHLKSGKLRLLGVNNAQRYHVIPDVPTISEQLPGYQAPPAWLAYFGPPGLPAPVASRLHSEITAALARPEIRAKAEDIGFVVATTSPEELVETVRRDAALVNRIIEAAGIKLE